MAVPAKARKRGRPALPPEEKKRPSMGFRPTVELREMIEQAAAHSGLSMTQEVERRLERSFSEEGYLALLYDDPNTAGFVRVFLDTKRLIEAHLEKSVWEDLESHEAMKSALKRLLAQNAPSPSGSLKKKMATYERYAERELKPWRERGGGGLLSNPDAGPMPTLKASPVNHARAVGRAAANVVHKDHQMKALLAEVLKANPHEED